MQPCLNSSRAWFKSSGDSSKSGAVTFVEAVADVHVLRDGWVGLSVIKLGDDAVADDSARVVELKLSAAEDVAVVLETLATELLSDVALGFEVTCRFVEAVANVFAERDG